MLAGFDGYVTSQSTELLSLGVIIRTYNCAELKRFNAHKNDPDYRPPDDRPKEFQYKYPIDYTKLIRFTIAVILILLLGGVVYSLVKVSQKVYKNY